MLSHRDTLAAALDARPLDEQAALLERGLHEQGLAPVLISAVMSTRQDALVLQQVDHPARSRLGGAGRVLLPTGEAWPVSDGLPLAFLFEIAMEDIVGIEGFLHAPRRGSLLVFHDEEPGLWASFRSATRVMFRRDDDPGVETSEGVGYANQRIAQVALEGFAVPRFAVGPELEAVLVSLGHDPDQILDLASEIDEAIEVFLPYDSPAHNLFGAPHSRREPLLTERIQAWFATPEAAEDRPYFTEAEMRGEGWRIFLEPDDPRRQDLGIEIDWSTGGYRYHVIPAVDLAAGRLDRVITIFD